MQPLEPNTSGNNSKDTKINDDIATDGSAYNLYHGSTEDDFVEFYVGKGPRESYTYSRESVMQRPTPSQSADSLTKQIPKMKCIDESKVSGHMKCGDYGNDGDNDDDYGDDEGWMDMEAVNDEAVYDDKGVLVADDHFKSEWRNTEDHFGYTRIAAEKQAEAYQNADKKTDFLFKSDKPLANEFRTQVDENDEQDEEDDTFINTDTSLEQIRSTKDLLAEPQKFAYVGLVNLIMVEMATDLATISVGVSNKAITSKSVKRINFAQSNFGQWQLRIIHRLYEHLELTDEEITMIDSLPKHGIRVENLTKSMKLTKVVHRPDLKGADISKDLSDKDELEIDISWTIICDLFLVLMSDFVYDSRSRTLFLKFAGYLGQDPLDVYQFERRITETLQIEDSSDQVWDESDILKERSKKAKKRKYMYVGLATLGGSLVIGLSAGLLAPLIGAGLAAGLTTIGISGTGGFLAGAGGTALVSVGGTAIGAKMGSQGMMKRVQDVTTFEFVPLHNNRRTNLIVTVSGWMSGKADDVRLPFSTVDPVMGDLYSVLWEPEMLKSTGQTIQILANEALSQSIQQILGATLLVGLMGAINIPMMLSKLFYIVDNPWNVSLDRAWKAGLILADTLINRNLGDRPITLLGFSLGSRVIYSCLLELAKRGAYGLVEKVIVFGSPFVISPDQLIIARSVVSGDFINGYSRKDWILGYLFRATSGGLARVAGLSPIEDNFGIQNFDCTDLIQGHLTYRKNMPLLLSQLGFSVLSEEFIEIDDDPDPEEEERQRKLISEFDEAKRMMDNEIKNGVVKKKSRLWGKWFKSSKKKEWWEMYSEKAKSAENLGECKELGTKEPVDVFDIDALIQKARNLQVNNNEDENLALEDSSTVMHEERKTLKPFTLAEDLEQQADRESTVQPDRGTEDPPLKLDEDEEVPKQEKITMTFA